MIAGVALGLLIGLPILWRSGLLEQREFVDAVGVNGSTATQIRLWLADPRFFVPVGTRMVTNHPSMVRQTFDIEKPQDEFRVFLLGGSAALGSPYVHSQPEIENVDLGELDLTNTGGIATWVESYFEILYPQRTVRVVNAAASSQDIRTAAAVFTAVVEEGSPDLVLVMSGNNESYAKEYRTSEEFETALAALTTRYAANVATIAALAEQRRVSTYFLSVPTNLRDWFPVGDTNEVPTTRITRAAELATSTPEAPEIDLLLEAVGDTEHPIYHYVSGLRHFARGNEDAAYTELLAAKDRDYNLIRAHSNWNRAALAAEGTYVRGLDLEQELRSAAEGGVPGFDLFHDNCHLTIEGNAAAARAIANFHQQEAKLHPVDLPKLDVRGYLKRNLEALYAIKAAKWTRIDELGQFEHLGEENRQRIAQQFQSEQGFLHNVDQIIYLYETDLDPTASTADPSQ